MFTNTSWICWLNVIDILRNARYTLYQDYLIILNCLGKGLKFQPSIGIIYEILSFKSRKFIISLLLCIRFLVLCDALYNLFFNVRLKNMQSLSLWRLKFWDNTKCFIQSSADKFLLLILKERMILGLCTVDIVALLERSRLWRKMGLIWIRNSSILLHRNFLECRV